MANVMTLVDRVEELFSEVPDKRKKKEYNEWKQTINNLIREINKLSKFTMYNEVK